MLAPETLTEITEADDGDLFLGVLDDAIEAATDSGVPFLFIGGIGSAVFGRDRGTRDIDLFVRPEGARRLLDALARHGFDTKVVEEHWLSKGFKHGVLVDVIFRSTRDILLDDEMLARARRVAFRGRAITVAPPEDLIVMKVSATGEETERYWYDALSILAHADLDWDYLCARARQHGARRVLSLLLFASSVDLVVPTDPIESLFETVVRGGRA